MKSQITVLVVGFLIMLQVGSFSQNVGISSNGSVPNTSAGLDVNFPNKGLLIPQIALTGVADNSTIALPATSLLIYNTATVSGLTPGYYYNAGTTSAPVWTKFATGNHYIGESYGGGIVYHVYDNGQHGLISATDNQSTGLQWYNGIYRYTGTTGDGVRGGVMNTAMITATQMSDNQTGNFAAKVCADYSINVGGVIYGDWYLPSKHELNLLYLQRTVVGGFGTNIYWSSSEATDFHTWRQSFNTGIQGGSWKNELSYVRAIRAF